MQKYHIVDNKRHFLVIFLILLTCMSAYLITFSGHHYSIDGIAMFQYAKSLLFHQSFQMNPPLLWGYEFHTSKWPIGLSLFYIPVLFILSITFFRGNPEISQIPYDSNLPYNPALLENRPYLFSAFSNPVITSITAVAVYLISLQMGLSQKRAVGAAIIFGIMSPAVVYAKLDFAQPLASLAMAFSVYFFLRIRPNNRLYALLSGLFLGFGILTRPEFILIPGSIMIIILYCGFFPQKPLLSNRRDSILILALFIIPIISSAVVNQYLNFLRFGSWASFGYRLTNEFQLRPDLVAMAIVGNLLSPGRGILLFYPFSILAIIGLIRLAKVDIWKAILYSTVTIGLILFYSTWKDWGGGVSWGPRFLIPILPYLTILALYKPQAKVSANKWSSVVSSFLVLVGMIAVTQGLLFNYLGFYGALNISQQVIDAGMYNFAPVNSPLIHGWKDLFHPETYDLFFFQRRAAPQYLFTLTGLASSFGILVVIWIYRFAGKFLSQKFRRIFFKGSRQDIIAE